MRTKPEIVPPPAPMREIPPDNGMVVFVVLSIVIAIAAVALGGTR